MAVSRFAQAAGVISVLGPLVAGGGTLALSTSSPFTGSVVGSALLALVFAAYSAYTDSMDGPHRPAAGVLATVLGGWLIFAPLAYDIGGVLTGIVQTGGLLTAAFAGYVTLDTLLPRRAVA